MDECTVGRGRSTARVAFFVSLGFQSDDDCCCCCLDARLGVYRNVRSRTDHSPRSAGEQNETMRKLAHNLGTPNCPAVTEYELMSRTETIVHCAFATWTHWEDFFFFPLLVTGNSICLSDNWRYGWRGEDGRLARLVRSVPSEINRRH